MKRRGRSLERLFQNVSIQRCSFEGTHDSTRGRKVRRTFDLGSRKGRPPTIEDAANTHKHRRRKRWLGRGLLCATPN